MKRIYLLVFLSFLSGAIFWFSSYQSKAPVSEEQLKSTIEARLTEKIENLSKVAEEIKASGKRLSDYEEFNFYRIKGDTVVEWSTNHFLPPVSVTKDSLDYRFFRAGSGDYLLVRWDYKRDEYLIGALPLSIHYKITNQYIKPQINKELFGATHLEILDPISDVGLPVSYGQHNLFRVKILQHYSTNTTWLIITALAGLLAFASLILTIIFLVKMIRTKSALGGFVVLFVCLLVVRLLLLFISSNNLFEDISLFDPQNFASSDLNPSLGDMFFNALVIMCLCGYLFRNYAKIKIIRGSLRNKSVSWILSILSSVLVFFGMLFSFVVIQTIYNNSSLNLSITESLHFDILRIAAFLIVMISWICSWLFMHVFIRTLTLGHNILRFSISSLIGVLVFIVINEFSGQVYFSSLLIGLLYLLIVLPFGLHKTINKFQYSSFVYFFIGVVCLAAVSLSATSHFEKMEKTRNQMKFASNFLIDRDYFGEYLLAEALSKIKLDGFIQSRMASPLLAKDPVRQKIRQYFLPIYFNKYNIEVQLFNTAGDPIENSSNSSLGDLLTQYDRETSQTGYSGVYYVAGIQGEFSQQYLAVCSLYRSDVLVGYVVLKISLKRIIPENVYPELLIDNRFQRLYNTEKLSYAVFHGGSIQFSSGEFNYEKFNTTDFSNPVLYSTGIETNGYHHIAVEDAVGKTVVVSSQVPDNFLQLANISFFILIGVSVVLVYLLIQGITTYIRMQSLFLAARIQLFLNMAFFIPLIAVSIITLTLTARSSQQQLNNDYLNKSKSFASQLSNYGIERNIESSFLELVKFSNADANLFSAEGRLVATSQPMIFENQLLAPVIKAEGLHRILQGEKNFVLTESVGSLNYFVAYSALNAPEDGSLRGIIALPFFQSGSSLEKMQIAVLANILVIFMLLFVVLLLTSFFVSKWLTFPLRLITRTLGKTSLLKNNQPLVWESNDEIGLMVKEYNQMLDKLSDSKSELERTQRERAWREIAQQVAHEIKNPLTPMKLTLQQLERNIAKGEESKERIEKSVTSLLSQVNTLDGIASSFSAFAKMPEPVMKDVDLVKLISSIEHIHLQSGVTFDSQVAEAPILADEQLLSRILTNIVLNGIHSVVKGSPLVIIKLVEDAGYFKISITDNGGGIEVPLYDKIFLPHFTTKQSGSGLGLAIAKQGIEQMGGRISFESTSAGTTFYVILPGKNIL